MQAITMEQLKAIGRVSPDSVIHADCLEAMSYIEDASIDMILADLPYG